MSLRPQPIPPVPEETARVARAAFPRGNAYLRLRDEFGALYEDQDFAPLFPARGQPGLPPWRLALVTVMQFLENLSDRQTAEAVRARIDWKYALGLELADPGFDRSVLSEFRTRLVGGGAEALLLDHMLARFRERGLLRVRGQQRTDSTHVLASIRVLNRLELVGETLRAALNDLAIAAPEWLRATAPPDWYARYAHRIEESRLPQGKEARKAYARTVGEDGLLLLDALGSGDAPDRVRGLPALGILREVWQRHYERTGRGVRLRDGPELPRAAGALESPYDPEARFRSKSGTSWTGYMVHLTETCGENEAHLITHVDTTTAAVHEATRTAAIHAALGQKGVPPGEHLVDAGYVSAALLVESRAGHGIAMLGPPRPNANWQARTEGAYSADRFQMDWDRRRAVCPQGKASATWSEQARRTGDPFVSVRFRAADCGACSARPLCTRSAKQPRQLFLPPRAEYEAARAVRERLASGEGRRLYAKRAGVEGTISQGVRAFGLRRSRYRGVAKTHLQHVATAAAINLARVDAWLGGRPHATTRTSRFARLAP